MAGDACSIKKKKKKQSYIRVLINLTIDSSGNKYGYFTPSGIHGGMYASSKVC